MAVYGIRAAEPANGVNATELQSEMQRVATVKASADVESLSLIHISEPTRR